MNRLILTTLFLVSALSLVAQTISVASFKSLPLDLTARIDFPLKDQNGDLCAIIKVVTKETGFSWDGDRLGIVKTEKRVGEYWLYVPYGAKRLSIMHEKLGILRDYIYTEAIDKACVYEMVLTTGKVKTIVEEQELMTIWLTLKSNPDNADVYINDIQKGVTPYPEKLTPGKYSYRLEKAMYHPMAGVVEITGEEPDGKKNVSIDLKPAFGFVKINTSPENGAAVFIDDIEIPGKTPVLSGKLKSGTHKVTVKKGMYQAKSKEVIVTDGQTIEETIVLSSNFANVSITSQPEANIFIDGISVGVGKYTGRVLSGVHSFEAKKESYYSDKKDREVEAGNDIIINFELKPQLGALDIVSNPIDVTVYLNGVQKGATPITFRNLLIGSYQVKFEKEGFATVEKLVVVNEGKTILLSEKLTAVSKDNAVSIADKKPLSGTTSVPPVSQTIKTTPENNVSKQVPIDAPNPVNEKQDIKVYQMVKIGKQTWMAENLSTTNFADGTVIPMVMENTEWSKLKTPGYCWYKNEKPEDEKYGILYNWFAASSGKLCPAGWHVPDDEEWSTLVSYLGGKNVTGGKLKEKGLNHWKKPNTGASDEYGFTALPGGYRKGNGSFDLFLSTGLWWSSTQNFPPNAWSRYLTSNDKIIFKESNDKQAGMSIRCIKDN